MNKFFYIVVLSIFLWACTSNTIIKKPTNLIPKEQMVDLLTDLYLANGGDHIKNINKQRNVNYFPFVFEKHQIDTTRFRESNYYYTSRIDDYDEILKKVEERLKALKKQYDAENNLNDSLARIKRDLKRKLPFKGIKYKSIEIPLPKYKKHSTEKDYFDYLNSSNYYIQNNLGTVSK